MFINNKYFRWYNNIIKNAIELNRPVGKGFETHHIIPRSLNGSNKKENLVVLTTREHFIVHRLLPKCLEGDARRKMLHALRMLANFKQYRVTSHVYSFLKEHYSQIGKTLSKETIVKIKTKRALQKCLPHSEESKRKIRDSNKTFWTTDLSEVAKEKISKANKGKRYAHGYKHREETKQLMREKALDRESINKTNFEKAISKRKELNKQGIFANADKTVYEFTSKKVNVTFIGTRTQFKFMFNKSKSDVFRLVNGSTKLLHKEWTISKEGLGWSTNNGINDG